MGKMFIKIFYAAASVLFFLPGHAGAVAAEPESGGQLYELSLSSKSVQDILSGQSLPMEIVIKGQGVQKIPFQKVPFKAELDIFSIFRANAADIDQFLSLDLPRDLNQDRWWPYPLDYNLIIQPYGQRFADSAKIIFDPGKHLADLFRDMPEAPSMKEFHWTIQIADEEGRSYKEFSGAGEPPKEVVWDGQSDKGDWIRAGHNYSVVYVFVDDMGLSRRAFDKSIRFSGFIRKDLDGVHICMDSKAMFAQSMTGGMEIEKNTGEELLRAAADYIKRNYYNEPLQVSVYAKNDYAAEKESLLVREYLGSQLKMPQDLISGKGVEVLPSEEQVEILITPKS